MLKEAAEIHYIMGDKEGSVERQKTENLEDNQRKIINKERNVEDKNYKLLYVNGGL